MNKKALVIMLLVILMAGSVLADRRNYVWTYQYKTMPEGVTELEFYQTTKLKETDEWEYRIEVETGLTDRWDVSIYQIFKQPEGGEFKWDAVQFRTRYRFSERGVGFVDPLLYLEYQRKLDLKKPNKFEAKFILARQFDQFDLSVNPVYEFFWGPGTEHEIGLDAGLAFEPHPVFSIGLESTSRKVLEDGTSWKSYLGPTISVARGHWWYSAGVAFGVTDKSDDARVRFLMGIEL